MSTDKRAILIDEKNALEGLIHDAATDEAKDLAAARDASNSKIFALKMEALKKKTAQQGSMRKLRI